MPIWFRPPQLAEFTSIHVGTAVERLGIEFTGVGDDWVSARMPVDTRTVQSFGILHGLPVLRVRCIWAVQRRSGRFASAMPASGWCASPG